MLTRERLQMREGMLTREDLLAVANVVSGALPSPWRCSLSLPCDSEPRMVAIYVYCGVRAGTVYIHNTGEVSVEPFTASPWPGMVLEALASRCRFKDGKVQVG